MHAFTVFSLTALVLMTLGRVQELFPILTPLQLGKVAVLLGLLAAVIAAPRNLSVLLRDTPMGRCLLVLFVLAFCGIPFSVLKSGALESFFGLCRMLLVASVLVALTVNGRLQSFRIACIGTVLLLACLMILDKGTGGRIHISSTYDPNDLGLLFVMFLPMIACEGILGGKLIKIFAYTAALLSVIAIALTGSRGGIVALAAVGMHTLLLVKKRRWLLIPALAAAAVVVGLSADEMLWERFGALQDNTDYNLHAKGGRLEIWKEGIGLMLRYPLLGVGLGQYPVGMGMLTGGGWKAAHNSFIQVGAELGVIGLGTFIAMLVFIYRLVTRGSVSTYLPPEERQRFTALQLCLTGYCVGGFFLSQGYGPMLFIFLVLAACMYRQLEEAQSHALMPEAPPPEQPVPAEQIPSLPLGEKPAGVISLRAKAVRETRNERLLKGDRQWQRAPARSEKP